MPMKAVELVGHVKALLPYVKDNAEITVEVHIGQHTFALPVEDVALRNTSQTITIKV